MNQLVVVPVTLPVFHAHVPVVAPAHACVQRCLNRKQNAATPHQAAMQLEGCGVDAAFKPGRIKRSYFFHVAPRPAA